MSGWSDILIASQGFGDKSLFRRHFEVGHRESDYVLYVSFRFCVQPRHWELEHRKVTTCMVCFPFCVQPRHWELEHRKSDDYVWYVYSASRSTKTLGVGTQRMTDMIAMFSSASAFNQDIFRGLNGGDDGANEYVSRRFCVSVRCTDAITVQRSCVLKQSYWSRPIVR